VYSEEVFTHLTWLESWSVIDLLATAEDYIVQTHPCTS